jgi:hypothetical protein
MNALPKDQLLLGSATRCSTLSKAAPLLKETFFLQTKEDDNDPTSRASSAWIANAAIFGRTATARCSSSRSSGASAPDAALHAGP